MLCTMLVTRDGWVKHTQMQVDRRVVRVPFRGQAPHFAMWNAEGGDLPSAIDYDVREFVQLEDSTIFQER